MIMTDGCAKWKWVEDEEILFLPNLKLEQSGLLGQIFLVPTMPALLDPYITLSGAIEYSSDPAVSRSDLDNISRPMSILTELQ